MIKHTQLKVPMTDFKVDVLIGGSKKEHLIIQKRLYDISEEDLGTIGQNEVCTIDTGENAEVGSTIKIFHLHLDKMPSEDIPVTMHEMWHLVWHISNSIPDFSPITYESHSFMAPFIEDLTRQLFNAEYQDLVV